MGTGDDAGDVAQVVLLAVANGVADFHHDHDGSFQAWVRGITRHNLLDYFRRRERQPAAAGTSCMSNTFTHAGRSRSTSTSERTLAAVVRRADDDGEFELD